MNNLNINQNYSIQQMQDLISKSGNRGEVKNTGSSFEEMLALQRSRLDSGSVLKFSKHANSRLEERDIDLTEEVIGRLEDGVRKAQEKGIKESLVMVDKLAFIVNVPNHTVVTAVADSAEPQVFSNIDGAVIA